MWIQALKSNSPRNSRCVHEESSKEQHWNNQGWANRRSHLLIAGDDTDKVPEAYNDLGHGQNDGQGVEDVGSIQDQTDHEVECDEEAGGDEEVDRDLGDLLAQEVDVSPVHAVQVLPEKYRKFLAEDLIKEMEEENEFKR